MVPLLKEGASINSFQVAGAAIAALSPLLLLVSIASIWVLTLLPAVVGLALLVYGYVVAFRFEPNAGDPNPAL